MDTLKEEIFEIFLNEEDTILGIAVTNKDLNFEILSKSFCNIFEIKQNEPRNLNDLLEDRVLQKIMNSDKLVEEKIVNGSKNEVYVSLQSKKIQINGNIHYLVYAKNITKEKSLNESNDFLKSLLKQKSHMFDILSQNIPVGIWQLNENGDLIYANRKFCELFDETFESLQTNKYIKKLYQYKNKVDYSNIASDTLNECELKIKTKSDSRWIQIKFNVIDTDVFKGMIGIAFDLSKEKEILPALIQLKKELSQEKLI